MLRGTNTQSNKFIPPSDVLAHVVDVHCHPTDSETSELSMAALSVKICAMATREGDQSLVHDLALSWPDKVTPCFGYHPWFSHCISLGPVVSKEHHYRALLLNSSCSSTDGTNSHDALDELLPDLPQPILLADMLATLRSNLADFPHAMVGEVGLDRAFRIPLPRSHGGRRRLSEFTVPLAHQMHILESQLQLAVELQRNVSLHSVKAQQATVDLFNRMYNKYGAAWDMISVDMHSCGLSPEMWTQLEKNHPNIYLSLSTAINARSRSHRELIAACNPNRILAESDFHDVRETSERTWDMCITIAEVKGWQVEEHWDPRVAEDRWGVVRRLEENWKTFSQGKHVKERQELEARKRNRKDRRDTTWDSAEEFVE